MFSYLLSNFQEPSRLITLPRKATSSSLGCFVVAILLLGIVHSSKAQTVVFSENFNTSTGAAFDTSGAIGSSTNFSLARSGADWGARIDGGLLTLTNDATATANVNGWVYGYTPTTSFASPYSTTLNANPRTVNWTFNMEQIRADPAGFTPVTSYGAAFVLGTTSTTVATAGNGYAVVLGNSGATDPIRLVSFTGGLQGTQTTLITATAPLADVGLEYLSLKVSYDPTTNLFSLFGRNDGISSFADPASGTLTSLGTVTNATYTSTSLTSLGGYWQGATAANQTAQFDNVTVSLSNFVFFDVNGGGAANPGSGVVAGGLYNFSSAFWNDAANGTGPASTFTNGETPTFSAGTDAAGLAYTVTIDSAVNANGIIFEEGSVTLATGLGTLTLVGPTINVVSPATADISEEIAGTVGLTKTGAGILTISGAVASSYSGTTTINGGLLDLAKTGAVAIQGDIVIGDGVAGGGLDILRLATLGSGGDQIRDTSVLRFNGTGGDAGTFQLNGKSETVRGLVSNIGEGVVENAGPAGSGSVITIGPAGGSYLFGGTIQDGATGTVAVNVVGSGTQTLTYKNTYTDVTRVTGATLQVDGASAVIATTSSIAVNGGGTLLLSNGASTTNRINDNAAISLANGTIAATGNSVEGTAAIRPVGSPAPGGSMFGLGALTLNADSTLDFGSATTGNVLVFDKGFIPNTFTLNITNWTNLTFDATPGMEASGIASDDRLVFMQDLSSVLGQISFGSGFSSAMQVDLGGGYFEIGATPIPEPGTVIAGMALLGLVGFRERRRVALVLGRW